MLPLEGVLTTQKRAMVRIMAKYQILHNLSLVNKDKTKKKCLNFWKGDDVMFDQNWSLGDPKNNFHKYVLCLAYLKENLLLIKPVGVKLRCPGK